MNDLSSISGNPAPPDTGSRPVEDQAVFVTRPSLPPLDELVPMLEEIWERRWLTNHGVFHQRFEHELASFLGVEHISLTANGMLGLEAAIDVAGLEGEVITTPYSFVATTHAVRRSGFTPVFVDIQPHDLNIDADLVEASITEKTSAIVAVHCYGNPCDTERLEAIAGKHGLKLIYDAAHAFDVRRNGRPVLANGDFSILSFHATKAFNTFEGGAVISSTREGKSAIDSGSNFGIANEVSIPVVGTNAKMSEFNAAVGLLQLRHFEKVRSGRRRVDSRYREQLAGVRGLELMAIPDGVEPNYSYFPVLVTEEFPVTRDALYEELKRHGIYSRRYFYPLLSNLPMYRELASAAPENLPVANRAAQQILCLPIYPDLAEGDQDRVIEVIRSLS